MNNIEKWNFAQKAIEEIENIERVDTSQEAERLSKLKEKLLRLTQLHEKVAEKEEVLHLQHVALLTERNLYLEKWKNIEKLGLENNWQDESGLLHKIRMLIMKYSNPS